jgi:hypothetical protein
MRLPYNQMRAKYARDRSLRQTAANDVTVKDTKAADHC